MMEEGAAGHLIIIIKILNRIKWNNSFFKKNYILSLKFLSLYLLFACGYTEKVGDVLRYTSQWTMGLPQGDGAVSTVASFAGGISWQCSLFDVMKSKDWPRVIEALTSNVEVSDIYIYIYFTAFI